MPPRPSSDEPLIPSVLDRLIDNDPQASAETPRTAAQVMRDLKQSIRRDLENLLNTRWRCTVWPPDLRELEVSLVNYGIPDFTGSKLGAAEDPDVLLRVVEASIRHFEPRLKNVRVNRLENANTFDRTLRFRIEGLLCVEAAEDRVWFDSTLEPATGNFEVQGGGR